MSNIFSRAFFIVLFCSFFVLVSSPSQAFFKRDKNGWGDPEKQSIQVGDEERRYILHVPEKVSTSKTKVPLLFVMHGGGGNGKNAVRMTGFDDVADREGFIVVYAEGSGRRDDKLLTWNAEHCCGYAMNNDADDVGFVSAVIDKMVKNYPVDARRVFVTGMSNGGMITHRIGRELSHKIRGIAPVVGGMFGDEALPDNGVAALIINGALDKSIPIDGGQTGGKAKHAWDGTPLKPVTYQGTYWAKANGCKADPVKSSPKKNVTLYTYSCPVGKDVIIMIAEDGGHAWHGGQAGSRFGDSPSQAFDSTEEIWAFFKALN